MRLVWRKRFGFSLVCYPIEDKGGQQVGGFKAGIFDAGGDMWWFSEETVKNSTDTQKLAYTGWLELLKEFSDSLNIFPDGTDPVDEEEVVHAEIKYTTSKTKGETPESVVDDTIPTVKEALKKVTGKDHDTGDSDNDGDTGNDTEDTQEEEKVLAGGNESTDNADKEAEPEGT